mmetsp:Transcript_10509/g.31260  ORF Transcript_10509/g.31260 Transcript_10509/m.31260 type:complete len:257 (+) Transcript_10509:898-1668(+)
MHQVHQVRAAIDVHQIPGVCTCTLLAAKGATHESAIQAHGIAHGLEEHGAVTADARTQVAQVHEARALGLLECSELHAAVLDDRCGGASQLVRGTGGEHLDAVSQVSDGPGSVSRLANALAQSLVHTRVHDEHLPCAVRAGFQQRQGCRRRHRCIFSHAAGVNEAVPEVCVEADKVVIKVRRGALWKRQDENVIRVHFLTGHAGTQTQARRARQRFHARRCTPLSPRSCTEEDDVSAHEVVSHTCACDRGVQVSRT